MNHTVSMRSVTGDAPVAPTVEFFDGTHQWRVVRAHAALLESGSIDWFHLERCPTARLVKKNCQREVWRVRCGGRDYFAKLYRPNGVLTRAKLLVRGATALREWNAGMYAAAHSIPAVVPVAAAWTGSHGGSGPSLLITEAIPDAEPLNDYWLRIRHDRQAANGLSDALARLIARAHQGGFRHGDMHPGNILVRRDGRCRETFLVDLHNVRIGRVVGLRAMVANLAQLNQWFRRFATRTQRRRFLKLYLAYRERFARAGPFAGTRHIEPASLIADLAVQADRHARKLWAKRDRRTLRTGKYFARLRPAPGWRGHVLLRSKHPSPTACAARLVYSKHQWERWLQDPLSWVDPQEHELLKDSHTATVSRATLPADPAPISVIVKRPLARSPWKRLGQMFGRSRNLRSWRIANMLINRNLPAAQPLAVVERYVAGVVRLDSIAMTDFIPGSADLETFLTRDVAGLGPRARWRVKDRLIEAVAALLEAFHARGFVHRDLKAPNLLVNWERPYDRCPRLTFIDMDGISHVRRPSERRRRRALVRLCASLLGSPACTRTDRLRFLRRISSRPGGAPSDSKEHWRAIQELVDVKLRQKQVRQLWKLDRYGPD